MKLLLLTLTLLFLNSCASYVKHLHKEFDKADRKKHSYQKDQFQQYRRNKRMEPKSMSSLNNPYVVPSTRRDYRPVASAKKRYKAQDLTDNQGDGSLWSGVEGRENFLFTNNENKRNGDIVLIMVADKLKREITSELKRAFPSPPPTSKKNAKGKKPASQDKATAQATTGAGADAGASSEEKVHDRISGVVIEEINKEHVLVRGRKNVLYKNRKRLVEVQALVAQRDIESDDTINSNQIIESNVSVLR